MRCLLCACLRRRGRRRLLHRRGGGLHRLDGGLLGAGLLGVQVRPDEADAHEREQAHGNDDGRRATVGELRFLWSREGRVVGTSVSPQCVSPCAHGAPRRDQPRTAAGAFRYCRLVSSSSRPAWGQEQREVSGGPVSGAPASESDRPGPANRAQERGWDCRPRPRYPFQPASSRRLAPGCLPLGGPAACLGAAARPRRPNSAQRVLFPPYAQVPGRRKGYERTMVAPARVRGAGA